MAGNLLHQQRAAVALSKLNWGFRMRL